MDADKKIRVLTRKTDPFFPGKVMLGITYTSSPSTERRTITKAIQCGRDMCTTSGKLTPNPERNLSALQGVRCLACLGVVILHVHFLNGGE